MTSRGPGGGKLVVTSLSLGYNQGDLATRRPRNFVRYKPPRSSPRLRIAGTHEGPDRSKQEWLRFQTC
jgi:hypothetical protein